MLNERLFQVIVVVGAGLAGGCAAVKSQPTERTPEPRPVQPVSTAEPAPQPQTASDARDADACECVGAGDSCTGDGVLCCWAQGECCEPCCPDVA